MLSHDPVPNGNQYVPEGPTYLQAMRYRIGFCDTSLSDSLGFLASRRHITNDQPVHEIGLFITCCETAFYITEQQEFIRCLNVLTGLAVNVSGRSDDKTKIRAPYLEWLANQAK